MTEKKALVVIDMQNDYLWDRRKAMFTYKTENLVESVNNAVAYYQKMDMILFMLHRCFQIS